MNLATIEMPQAEAKKLFEKYRASLQERHDDELAMVMKGYKALAAGHSVLNIVDAMRVAGIRDDGYPVLAICRADEKRCEVEMRSDGGATFCGLQRDERWHSSRLRRVRLPADTFHAFTGSRYTRATMVPLVPAPLRPKFALSNYHLLWEVDKWKAVPPRDPALLKRIGGDLFAVIAVWDLTEVERAVLGLRRTT